MLRAFSVPPQIELRVEPDQTIDISTIIYHTYRWPSSSSQLSCPLVSGIESTISENDVSMRGQRSQRQQR